MSLVYYFAYGSNVAPERMKERKVKFKSRERGGLRGWKLVFNKRGMDGTGKANIEREEGGVVEGALYLLKKEELEKLYPYEGFKGKGNPSNHYDLVEVEVERENGERVKALTFVALPWVIDNSVKPARWYLNLILKGKDLFSREYYEALSKVETVD